MEGNQVVSLELPENLPENPTSPYEMLLVKEDEYIHQIVQGIMNCKTNDVKRTKCAEIAAVLRYFSGSSPHKQKEALTEFLTIMPEYRTTNPELLEARFKALKDELKRRGEITDLLIWAKLKYQKPQSSENEA